VKVPSLLRDQTHFSKN